MCYPRGEFRVGDGDVFLGRLEDTPVYIGGQQFEYWQHTHLTIDVVPGRGSGFSLEAPRGVRLLTRSRSVHGCRVHACCSVPAGRCVAIRMPEP
jgi:uncharacterized protein